LQWLLQQGLSNGSDLTIRFIGDDIISENQPMPIKSLMFEVSWDGHTEICAVSKNGGLLFTWFENGENVERGWTTHIGGGARAN